MREGMAQSRFTLTSPISGVVAELGVREGVMVQPGMALFRIVDLSTRVGRGQRARSAGGAGSRMARRRRPDPTRIRGERSPER